MVTGRDIENPHPTPRTLITMASSASSQARASNLQTSSPYSVHQNNNTVSRRTDRRPSKSRGLLVAVFLVASGSAFGQDALNVVSNSCVLPSHTPIYEKKRDPKCGVDYVASTRRPECGVQEYNSCRASGNGIQSYVEVAGTRRERNLLAIPIKQGNARYGTPAQTICQEVADRMNGFSGPTIRVQLKSASKSAGTCANYTPPADFPTSYSPCEEYKCVADEWSSEPVFVDAPNASCGVKQHKACDQEFYLECRHSSFPVEAYSSEQDFNCGFDLAKIAAMANDQYFSGLQTLLIHFIANSNARSDWDNFRSYTSESNLIKRRVPYQVISAIKLVMLGMGNPAPGGLAKEDVIRFELSDLLVRLQFRYSAGRAKDVLTLRQVVSLVKKDVGKINNLKTQLLENINNVNLPLNSRKIIEARIDEATAASIDELYSVSKDLLQALQSDIAVSEQETADFVSNQLAIGARFIVSFARLHAMLSNGSYVLAIAKYQEAVSYFANNQVAGLSVDADWLSAQLKENASRRVEAELDALLALTTAITTDQTLDLVTLGITDEQVLAAPRLISLLNQLNADLGDALAPLRLQLLNLISTTVIDPLSNFRSAL